VNHHGTVKISLGTNEATQVATNTHNFSSAGENALMLNNA